MIRFESELGFVLLFLTETVKALDARAAMRAIHPFARGSPRELRRLGRLPECLTRLEQRAYVDAVVDRRLCHAVLLTFLNVEFRWPITAPKTTLIRPRL